MANNQEWRSREGDHLTPNGSYSTDYRRVHNDYTGQNGYVDNYGNFVPDKPKKSFYEKWFGGDEGVNANTNANVGPGYQAQRPQQQQETPTYSGTSSPDPLMSLFYQELFKEFYNLVNKIARKKQQRELEERLARERGQEPEQEQQPNAQPNYTYTPKTNAKPVKKPFEGFNIPRWVYVGIILFTVYKLFNPIINWIDPYTIPLIQGKEIPTAVVFAAGILMAIITVLIASLAGLVVCFLVWLFLAKHIPSTTKRDVTANAAAARTNAGKASDASDGDGTP